MAYWIFKCNPDIFHLDRRLTDPIDQTTWTVTRFQNEIAPGDTVFLWMTGQQRGIRAVLRIDEAPRLMSELEHEKDHWATRDTEEKVRALCAFTHRNVDLPHTLLRDVPGLENLSVFHGFQQATNFPVTPDEGAILMRLVEDGAT